MSLLFKISKKVLPFILASLVMLTSGCSSENDSTVTEKDNLLNSVQKNEIIETYNFLESVETPANYENYYEETANYCVNLFKNLDHNESENLAVSPISSALSLAVLENGAGSNTQKEIRKVIGNSKLNVESINLGSNYLVQRLKAFNDDENGVFIANSFWFNSDISVKRGFLQKNENYFSFPTYSVDMANENTKTKMENFTIDSSNNIFRNLDFKLESSANLQSIASLVIKDNWLSEFSEEVVSDSFYNDNANLDKDENETATYLTSTERYIKTAGAAGFVKNLKNTPCMFVALLPNEESSLSDFVDSLDGSFFYKLSKNIPATDFVKISIPTFSADVTLNLKSSLESIGTKTLFTNKADFSKISDSDISLAGMISTCEFSLSAQGICTDKTIEDGTSNNSAEKEITFNRPFFYAVIENESGIPLIMGTMNTSSTN